MPKTPAENAQRLAAIRRKHADTVCGDWSRDDDCFLLYMLNASTSMLDVVTGELSLLGRAHTDLKAHFDEAVLAERDHLLSEDKTVIELRSTVDDLTRDADLARGAMEGLERDKTELSKERDRLKIALFEVIDTANSVLPKD